MKNESQSTQQNVIFKSYYPGLADLPRSLAASVREALGLSPASRLEPVSAIGSIHLTAAAAHRSPANLIYADGERIIVELEQFYPVAPAAANAATACPYLRVWIEATSIQDLLMPSHDETVEEIQSAALALAPLFNPALGTGLSTLDSRKIILRITSYNALHKPAWFASLKKRNVISKFQQARVDGQTEMAWSQYDSRPPIQVTLKINTNGELIGEINGDDAVLTRPALPAEVDGMLFPFHAGRSMCTEAEWQPTRILNFIDCVWKTQFPGYTSSLGVATTHAENNSEAQFDYGALPLLENLEPAFRFLNKHFSAEHYSAYPAEYLKNILEICGALPCDPPGWDIQIADTFQDTLEKALMQRILDDAAHANGVKDAVAKRRI